MSNEKSNQVLQRMLAEIELPESAYERAEQRYNSLYEWLTRDGSSCVEFDPHVFSAGSFRIGTAIKPENGKETYDLDIPCELQRGINPDTHSQEDLKNLIGNELRLYREAKGVKKPLIEKRRCWTLEYGDQLCFEMDIVPCIPASVSRQTQMREAMILNSRIEKNLAGEVASLAVSITDNEEAGYTSLSSDWRISNPEGYAKWFENRMKTATEFVALREAVLKASIDSLPHFRWKSPLQQAMQLLKRHRDTMYRNKPTDPERGKKKPISAIITTLSAKAYQGEADVASALRRILQDMDKYINSVAPRVPNPVNPAEDFADKWDLPSHSKYELEKNFYLWLEQARIDFEPIREADDPERIVESSSYGLDLNLSKAELRSLLGVAAAAPAIRTIHAEEPSPWFHKKK